jgi:hypothetical protein
MTDIFEQAFEEKRMDRTFHAPLVRDIQKIAAFAGIPVPMVASKLSDYCETQDTDYALRIRKQAESSIYGLAYCGKAMDGKYAISSRMQAIAGVCLRNYINARVMSVQNVIKAKIDGDFIQPTVLLIPNFYIVKSGMTGYQAAALLDLFIDRLSQAQQTVVYVQDIGQLEKDFGPALFLHIKKHFMIANV